MGNWPTDPLPPDVWELQREYNRLNSLIVAVIVWWPQMEEKPASLRAPGSTISDAPDS